MEMRNMCLSVMPACHQYLGFLYIVFAIDLFNPFQPSVTLIYPQKISENATTSWNELTKNSTSKKKIFFFQVFFYNFIYLFIYLYFCQNLLKAIVKEFVYITSNKLSSIYLAFLTVNLTFPEKVFLIVSKGNTSVLFHKFH